LEDEFAELVGCVDLRHAWILPLAALRVEPTSDDVILNILARRREPPRPLAIVTPEDLALRHPPRADCGRYDSLRGFHAAA
jgi:hypothetical protein